MIDLKDTTFIIPVKIEHPDRSNNLKIVVDYISSNFDTNIIINEQDEKKVPEILKGYNFHYMQSKRDDGLIHRTKQLNDMTKEATTPFIVNYDTDVVLPIKSYVDSINVLRLKQADFVFPYNGRFMDVPKTMHPQILQTKSIAHINSQHCHCNHPSSLGGALFFNKDQYKSIGYENENFISWGYEDNERVVRMKKFNKRILRTKLDLFHLNHHRTQNSSDHNPYYKKNAEVFTRINMMNPNQLLQEIKTWSWV